MEVGLVSTANSFLLSENSDEVHYAVTLLMNASLLLEGKDEIVDYKEDEIIKRLIFLLDRENETLRVNCKQTLINSSDLKRGFVKVTKYLFFNLKFLDEVFSKISIRSLGPRLLLHWLNCYPPLPPFRPHLSYPKTK